MLPTILPITIKSTNDITYNISDLVFKQSQFPNSLLNCWIEKGHRVYCPTWFSAAFRASSHSHTKFNVLLWVVLPDMAARVGAPHNRNTQFRKWSYLGAGCWLRTFLSPLWLCIGGGVAGRLRILLPEIHFLFLAMSRSTKRLLLTPPASILAHWPHLGPTNTPPTHHHHHYAFMHP